MQREFSRLDEDSFDLLILGGGIYGAWTAYDAALRGLKVALVDAADWASATSSASSKLIHGGLRYLEYYQFRLVRKTLAERKRLVKIAPHRVYPLRFFIPIYAGDRVGRWKFKAGLTLYDLLAGFGQPVDRHRSLSSSKLAEHCPFLRSEGLKGGFSYGDCGTDDARLVLEVIAAAHQAGACTVSYAKAEELLRDGSGRVVGAKVRDVLSDECSEVRARQTLNVTGPYADGLLQRTEPEHANYTRLTKGIHLSLPALPGSEAFLFTSPLDGRVFFFFPWYGRTIVGTTDTPFDSDPAKVGVDQEDIDYVLRSANHFLRDRQWTPADVQGSWAGLRTLRNEEGLPPSAVTREWTLEEPLPGLWMPVGGKLTSARVEAGLIVDRVEERLGKSRTESGTGNRPLPWAPPVHDLREFADWMRTKAQQASSLGIDAEAAEFCARRYGVQVDRLYRIIEDQPQLAKRLHPEVPFLKAEWVYVARFEYPQIREDVVRRRIPISLLARLDSEQLQEVASLVDKETTREPA